MTDPALGGSGTTTRRAFKKDAYLNYVMEQWQGPIVPFVLNCSVGTEQGFFLIDQYFVFTFPILFHCSIYIGGGGGFPLQGPAAAFKKNAYLNISLRKPI
jgi:hypothetical protein